MAFGFKSKKQPSVIAVAEPPKPLRTIFIEPYSNRDFVDIICETIKSMQPEQFNELLQHYQTRDNEFIVIEDGEDRYTISDKTRSLYARKDGKNFTVSLSEPQYTDIITAIIPFNGKGVIALNIYNTTNYVQPVTLFGANMNTTGLNYNNPIGIKITSASAQFSYLQILANTTSKPTQISFIRVCSPSNREQKKQEVKLRSTNSHGQNIEQIIHNDNTIDPFGMQPEIFDIVRDFILDANTEIEFNMLPSKKALTIYLLQKHVAETPTPLISAKKRKIIY